MRTTNPLRDIIEHAMTREEPLLDTEWPAGDVVLKPDEPQTEAREARFLRPVVVARR